MSGLVQPSSSHEQPRPPPRASRIALQFAVFSRERREELQGDHTNQISDTSGAHLGVVYLGLPQSRPQFNSKTSLEDNDRMETHSVIIIGGGVAGLMAARTFLDARMEDFCIVSKQIGGRIQCSDDALVNYGAYFVTRRYRQLWPYLKLKRRMYKASFGFVNDTKVHSIQSLRTICYLPQFTRVFRSLLRFDKQFKEFRKRCLYMSQKQALEYDPYLLGLYRDQGSEVLHELRALDAMRNYFDQLGNFIGFTDCANINGFALLQWASEMLLYPLYEFQLDTEKLMRGCKEKLIRDEVTEIHRVDNRQYIITSHKARYSAKHVVIATEPWVARQLVHIDAKSSDLVSTHFKHIVGVPKGIATKKRYLMFPSAGAVKSITRQADGSYLIYSDHDQLDLSKYFEAYQVIHAQDWQPALAISSHELVDSRQGENLWIAGAINIEGMEDCALSGIYAASQILEHRYQKQFQNRDGVRSKRSTDLARRSTRATHQGPELGGARCFIKGPCVTHSSGGMAIEDLELPIQGCESSSIPVGGNLQRVS